MSILCLDAIRVGARVSRPNNLDVEEPIGLFGKDVFVSTCQAHPVVSSARLVPSSTTADMLSHETV
jgi:hypothetical protein